MKRQVTDRRSHWQERVSSLGLRYHTLDDGRPYWDEGAFYALSPAEVELLEDATEELHRLCLKAIDQIVTKRDYHTLGFSDEAGAWIEASWKRGDRALYGRFDLAMTGEEVKVFEFNADTPTSLLETLVQWVWFEEYGKHEGEDQFNSVHDKLVAGWSKRLTSGSARSELLHFLHLDDIEDAANVGYLRDCAVQAGWKTKALWVEELGWQASHGERAGHFVDLEGLPIDQCFKLYPWESLFADFLDRWRSDADFQRAARESLWIEPPWKALLSSKAIWAYLWKLFPRHPYLLETYTDQRGILYGPLAPERGFVRKPFFSREGANVEIHRHGEDVVAQDGPYGDGSWIMQRYVDVPTFDGFRPVIGSWVIDGEPAGIGIRETRGLVTNNQSSFVPHVVGV